MNRFLRRVGQALCAALAACAISVFSAGVADDVGVRRTALDAAAPKAEPAKIGRHSAPLTEDTIVVLNRPIVTLRAPFLGISPAELREMASTPP